MSTWCTWLTRRQRSVCNDSTINYRAGLSPRRYMQVGTRKLDRGVGCVCGGQLHLTLHCHRQKDSLLTTIGTVHTPRPRVRTRSLDTVTVSVFLLTATVVTVSVFLLTTTAVTMSVFLLTATAVTMSFFLHSHGNSRHIFFSSFLRQQQSPCLSCYHLTATAVTVSFLLPSQGNSSHRFFLLTATAVTVSFFSRQQQSPCLSFFSRQQQSPCLSFFSQQQQSPCLSLFILTATAVTPPPHPQHQLKGRAWRRHVINLQSFSWGGHAAVSCRRLSDNRSQQLPLSRV